MDLVGDRLQSVGEALPIDLPVADRIGPVLLILIVGGLLVPAGIEPEYLRDDVELLVATDQRDRIVGRQAGILVAGCRIAVVEARADRIAGRLAVDLARMMRQNEPTESVMPGEAVLALPEKQADARGADRLRGIEIGGQIFLPGAQRDASLRAGRHIGEPCPGPADGYHRAPAVGSLDVEKREGVLRRASALGSHIERIAGSQHFRPLMEIGFRHMAAIGIMYGEAALAGRRQVQIDDLDLLDRRRIGIRQVLEAQHPFDRSEIGEPFHAAFDLQAAAAVLIRVQILAHARFGIFDTLSRVFPLAQQSGRRFAVIDEREGRYLPFRETGLDPAAHVRRRIGKRAARLGRGRERNHSQQHERKRPAEEDRSAFFDLIYHRFLHFVFVVKEVIRRACIEAASSRAAREASARNRSRARLPERSRSRPYRNCIPSSCAKRRFRTV